MLRLSSQRGSILVLALLVIVPLTMTGTILLREGMSNERTAARMIDSAQRYATVESLLAEAASRYANGETAPFSRDNFNVALYRNSTPYLFVEVTDAETADQLGYSYLDVDDDGLVVEVMRSITS